MLLAAGRGERMRPLSDHTPKPMLPVKGKPLMQWAMESMQRAGVQDLVVNTAWLGEQITKHFGSCFDGDQQVKPSENKPMQMHYSQEGADFGEALETAGGIIRALPMLADVFWVAAGDVWMPDFSFAREAYASFAASKQLAHIWLVPNPVHNPRGDFGIAFHALGASSNSAPHSQPMGREGLALNLQSDSTAPRWTFSTVALYKKAFFQSTWCDIPAGNPYGVKAPLAPMLRAAMDNGLVGATLYEQVWSDVGTPERLDEINNKAR
jgi:MurNAc alpha-1-phosphate uridylyltransferase